MNLRTEIDRLGPWFHNLHLPGGEQTVPDHFIGGDVVAIDHDARYLAQARWACKVYGLGHKVEFRQLGVYGVAQWEEKFDLVWFMGVFYHLRYPLLALDLLASMTRRMLVFQTLTMPGDEVHEDTRDHPITERDPLLEPGWPKMAFIEHRFAGDPTNWWVANHAGCEAMLRSTGLRVVSRPADEIYVCEPAPRAPWAQAQLDEVTRSFRP